MKLSISSIDTEVQRSAHEGRVPEVTGADLSVLRSGRLPDRLRPAMSGTYVAGLQDVILVRDQVNIMTLVMLGALGLVLSGVTVGLWLSETLGALLGVAAIPVFVIGLVVSLILDTSRPKNRAFAARLRRDLKSGVVQAAAAEVCAHGGQYMSRAGGRRLRMTEAAGARLRSILAPHRAHFLPESGLVVHVEPLVVSSGAFREAPQGSAEALDLVTRLLAKAHGFDLAWLSENRQGHWADGQARLVQRRILRVPAVLGVVVLDCFNLLWREAATYRSSPSFVSVALVFVLTVAWLVFTGRRLRKLTDETLDVPVACIEGPVRFTLRPPGPSALREPGYEIEGVRLPVPEAAGSLLIEGFIYRLHYSPRSTILLGIEAIGVAGA